MPTLQEAFGVKTLNRALVVAKAEDKGEQGFFQGLFRSGRPLRLGMGSPMADYLEWERVDRPTKPAPFSTRDSRFAARSEQDRSVERLGLADIKLVKHLPGPRIFATTGFGSAVVEDVPELLADELLAMRKEALMARELLASQILRGGQVSIGPTQIQGMQMTISFTFPNVNTGYVPAQSWATSTSKIASAEIPTRLKDAYYQAARMQAKKAIIPPGVHGYLRGNAEIQNIYAPVRQQGDKGLPVYSSEPGNMFNPGVEVFELDGIQWHVSRAGYDSPAGVFTPYVAANELIVLPGDLSEVLGHGEGHGVIPRQAIGSNPAALIEMAPTPGEYSYATASEDPAGVNLYYGWRGNFALLFGEGVLYRSSLTTTA